MTNLTKECNSHKKGPSKLLLTQLRVLSIPFYLQIKSKYSCLSHIDQIYLIAFSIDDYGTIFPALSFFFGD